MKKLILATIALCGMQISAMAEDRPIQLSELPTVAQTFIATHFKNQPVQLVTIDKELMDNTSYEIKFTNGSQVEFNGQGVWTDVQCKSSQVPQSIIPSKIAQFVTKNHSSSKILKIERNTPGFELQLNTGEELEFNSKQKFIRYDN